MRLLPTRRPVAGPVRANNSLADLVERACHDLRNPLATVYGFARVLQRTELGEPSTRYVEMIEAASELGELLDELALVARIEAGRFEPNLEEADSLELAQAAAAELSEERLLVSGEGAAVLVPREQMVRALARLAKAAARHGGRDGVALEVRGSELVLSPVAASAAAVVTGNDLRELSAAAAVALIEAIGGSLQVDDETLRIRLPAS
jgi:signal transduction histidine kinase